MKRAGVLGALLATAALMCALPGLLRMPAATDRAAQQLKPARLRTLTVWLMPGDVGDRRLISELCAAYEKQRDGVRVFLRVVTAEEFAAENAVLPDAALFQTGDIAVPEDVFVPLAQSLSGAGSHAGLQLAEPLWLSPNVLSVPAAWTAEQQGASYARESLLASATAPPEKTLGLLTAQDIPWGMLLQEGGLQRPSGVALQQLLYACPTELRQRLTGKEPAPAQLKTDAPGHAMPKSLGASPTPVPAIASSARVQTLAEHAAAVKRGEKLAAFALEPAVSSRVRMIALCRDNEDAQAFLRFLMENRGSAANHSLIAPGAQMQSGDALQNALAQLYGAQPPLPNAFAHTRQELESLCRDAFERCEDPVQTLLGLR